MIFNVLIIFRGINTSVAFLSFGGRGVVSSTILQETYNINFALWGKATRIMLYH
jgi:hypothetical protein